MQVKSCATILCGECTSGMKNILKSKTHEAIEGPRSSQHSLSMVLAPIIKLHLVLPICRIVKEIKYTCLSGSVAAHTRWIALPLHWINTHPRQLNGPRCHWLHPTPLSATRPSSLDTRDRVPPSPAATCPARRHAESCPCCFVPEHQYPWPVR